MEKVKTDLAHDSRAPQRAVLVVDDDAGITHRLREWLRDAGHPCIAVDTPEHGFEVLTKCADRIWLVVFDLRITGKYGGVDLLDRLIEMAHKRDLQTILMSSSEDVIVLALDHGCDEFLSKPVVKELFLKRVETLERLALLRELAETAEVCESKGMDRMKSPITLKKLLQFWKEPKVCSFPKESNITDGAVAKVRKWSFNVFDYSEDELLVLGKSMFLQLGLVDFCNVSVDVLERFLVAVRQGYNDNPYHNWRHAFDVAQATFVFLVQFNKSVSFTLSEQLALLVASLCHDLGHPGCNNDYLVRTECEIAKLYNHRSVLENCHSFMLFRMLDK
jgi:CheY-like chemotaxis protein